jgi:hypothetical protein
MGLQRDAFGQPIEPARGALASSASPADAMVVRARTAGPAMPWAADPQVWWIVPGVVVLTPAIAGAVLDWPSLVTLTTIAAAWWVSVGVPAFVRRRRRGEKRPPRQRVSGWPMVWGVVSALALGILTPLDPRLTGIDLCALAATDWMIRRRLARPSKRQRAALDST